MSFLSPNKQRQSTVLWRCLLGDRKDIRLVKIEQLNWIELSLLGCVWRNAQAYREIPLACYAYVYIVSLISQTSRRCFRIWRILYCTLLFTAGYSTLWSETVVKGEPKIFQWGARSKGQKAESGVDSWGGAATLSSPARASGERWELPQRGSGRIPDRPKFSYYFQNSGWPLLTL